MALKILTLLLLVLTVTKACDLDWILEDVIYDDSDSGEDESSEKPGNNSTSSTPAPSSSPPITTKPSPNIPEVSTAAPSTNSAPSNSSSRAFEETSTGKRRRRRTHHRRRVIRRIPGRGNFEDRSISSEGRGFNSEFDQFPPLGRFAPLTRTKLVQEQKRLTHPVEKKHDIEEVRAFTSSDFDNDRHVPFIKFPTGRTRNTDVEINTEEQDESEPQEFIKIFIGPLGRKQVEQQVRSFADAESLIPTDSMESSQLGEEEQVRGFTSRDLVGRRHTPEEERTGSTDLEGNIEEQDELESRDFIKIFVGPLGRTNVGEQVRSFTDDFKEKIEEEEEQLEPADLVEDVGEQVRSFPADEFHADADILEPEIPEGRSANPKKHRQRSKYSINSSQPRLTKRVLPTSYMSKSDVRKYVKEYLKKLLRHDSEGKIFESNEYVYIPVPKSVLNKNRHHSHSSHIEKQKGSNVVSIINREYSYELPKLENLENEEQKYVTLLLPQTSHKVSEPSPSTQHMMLQNQNPRRPILVNPDESDTHRLVDDLPEDPKNPTLSHVNHIKEHILRETVKINPIDHSEIHNVHEQTRLSIIKNPRVPIELTMENHDITELDNSPSLKKPADPENGHVMHNSMSVPQIPPIRYDFHQSTYQQPESLMIQQLPMIDSKINFLQGYAKDAPTSILNKYGEGHMVNQPGPSKLSEVYLQATTYPINYPINNLPILHKQPHHDMNSEQLPGAVQEKNFYLSPGSHEMDHTQHNVHEDLQHEAAPPHKVHHDPQYQQLPLLDMINNFNGHGMERPILHDHEQGKGSHVGELINHDTHHGAVAEVSTPPVTHVIKNAV